MIGIVLLSHGKMAEGMLDSCKLFFGEEIEGITTECLLAGDDPEEFDDRINDAINRVDQGNGVVILCDLIGGTPCNRCAYILNDRIQVIAGMNLSLLLELLGNRSMYEDIKDYELNTLIETGRNSLASVNQMMEN